MNVTIDEVVARQKELAAMIEQLQQPAAATVIHIDEQDIELRAGEHYAGAVLDDNGQHQHDLVLMAAQPDRRLSWKEALAWAESVGGVLPTRQEQALLFANCRKHLVRDWHWSSEEHESDASYAWNCYFDGGYQNDSLKSYEACAVAVRRV